jgi:hypothetical protein
MPTAVCTIGTECATLQASEDTLECGHLLPLSFNFTVAHWTDAGMKGSGELIVRSIRYLQCKELLETSVCFATEPRSLVERHCQDSDGLPVEVTGYAITTALQRCAERHAADIGQRIERV